MNKALQTFHLFVENSTAPVTPAASGNGAVPNHQLPESLEIPSDRTSYVIPNGGGRVHVTTDQPSGFDNTIVLETVRYEHRPYLSALFPEKLAVRVNGLAPPPLAILRPRDIIEIDGQHALHVSLFTRRYIGTPPKAAIGKECPVCLTPIGARATVYVCPFCQAALHAGGAQSNRQTEATTEREAARPSPEGHEKPNKQADIEQNSNEDAANDAAEDQLECVKLSSCCPRCEQQIVLREGYAYVPEL